MEILKRIIGIILVAAVITALVLLVVTFIKSRTNVAKSTSGNTQVTASPAANQPVDVNVQALPQTSTVEQVNSSQKTINSLGNVFSVPASWGVLGCTNSANFELDPTSGSESKVCDIAEKPITVLVNSRLACKGSASTIGNVSVQKYRVENVRGVDYQWCFSKNGVNYNITHRVSASGVRGTSVVDYSAKIEEMISSVK